MNPTNPILPTPNPTPTFHPTSSAPLPPSSCKVPNPIPSSPSSNAAPLFSISPDSPNSSLPLNLDHRDPLNAEFLLNILRNPFHPNHQDLLPFAPDLLRNSLHLFAKLVLPDLCRLNFSEMHHDLFSLRQNKMSPPPDRQGAINLTLAPRGAAKSTLVSFIFPLHAMLHKLDPYIVLISATQRQAITRLDNIRRALRHNPMLRKYFPREMKTLERSSRTTIVLNGCRLDAFSVGTEIRGITHGEWRPTWIILDDVESSSRVLNPNYRDNVTNWMREVIENLGDRYTNVDLVGTLLHTDALPVRMRARPDVKSETYKSILAESENPKLWENWLALLNDLADPDRIGSAQAYYKSQRVDMLAGAKVLWDEKEDYYDLQLKRATLGAIAFNQEKQNEPPTESQQWFPLESLIRFNPATFEISSPTDHVHPAILSKSLLKFGFLDPSLGTSKRSDYSTIVTLGFDPVTTYLYVLDVWMERVSPSLCIPKIFDLHAQHRYHSFGIETNAFQSLLLEPIEMERAHRRKVRQPANLDIISVRHTERKGVRIFHIEPLVRRGWIRFADNLNETFMRQLTEYPKSTHDDGPDALAAVVQLARDRTSDLLMPVGVGLNYRGGF